MILRRRAIDHDRALGFIGHLIQRFQPVVDNIRNHPLARGLMPDLVSAIVWLIYAGVIKGQVTFAGEAVRYVDGPIEFAIRRNIRGPAGVEIAVIVNDDVVPREVLDRIRDQAVPSGWKDITPKTPRETHDTLIAMGGAL